MVGRGSFNTNNDIYEWSKKRLETLPHGIKEITEEILKNIDIDLENSTIYLKNESVFVKNFEDLEYPLETLLFRSGYAEKLGEKRGLVLLLLTNVIREWVSEQLKTKPSIEVEIKHVTEREVLVDDIVNEILSKYKIKTFYIPDPHKQVELGIYRFNGLVYVNFEEELKKEIMELVNSRAELRQRTTRWVVNEVLFKVRILTLAELHYEPLKIAFKNGIFDWEKFLETGSLRESLIPPNPELIVFHKIPHKLALEKLEKLEGLVKFSEELALSDLESLAKKLCPKTLKAFKDWVGDKWVLLFEIIGYTLYPKYDLHKAIMIVGEGRNGKSTYLRLLKDILGSWNVSNVKLQDLCDDSKRFVVSNLYHKLANIYADLPSEALKYTGTFKIITGEDPITADRKFKDPITFVNYAKLIFSTNQLPMVRDMTLAFWRRWLVIEFPNQFPVNPNFYDETFTEEEKEGAIIVGLLAFRSVWLRRKFSFEETEADYRERWLREVNSVYAFIQELLEGKIEGYKAEKDLNAKVEANKLYELYAQWCDFEDREALTKRLFTIEMERLGYRKVKVRNQHYYKGLKLIEEKQVTL